MLQQLKKNAKTKMPPYPFVFNKKSKEQIINLVLLMKSMNILTLSMP